MSIMGEFIRVIPFLEMIKIVKTTDKLIMTNSWSAAEKTVEYQF